MADAGDKAALSKADADAPVGGGDVEAPGLSTDAGAFGVSPAVLNAMNENKDMAVLSGMGGIEGLAKALQVDLHHGLDEGDSGPTSIAARQAAYGKNVLPETPPKSFLGLVWDNMHDPIIIVLMAAATISTVLGAAIKEQREHGEFIEGIAIWCAVLIVLCVGAGNDWKKDQQFRKLNASKDIIRVKVLRAGKTELVVNTDMVVGDVYLLDTGDKVIADGVLLATQGLVIDEASLTGESDPIKKNMDTDPWVRSGTQVSEGSGKILITAVGTLSEWGKTMALVGEAGDDETPLQIKLANVASTVGKCGVVVAVSCFIALIIKWCVANNGFPIKKINDNGPIQFFLFAITIIVVAIPEGLPLAVTISLAYSMGKMMKDNNFVRVLSACETMGGATAICSDKTGTLTENRMTVVQGVFSGTKYDHAPTPSELPPAVTEDIRLNCALNSKAFIMETGKDGKLEFAGNRTECALLLLLRAWGDDYNKIREDFEARLFKLYGFSSAKKMASCVIKMDDKYRIYNKGAAEWVLARCVSMHNASGAIVPMTDADREALIDQVTTMAKTGLRCLCLTYTDIPLNDPNRPDDFFEDSDNVDKDLICLCIVGIKDPVRKEVPDAVAKCKRAGITVRMVTGDNIHTAQHIARECGILEEEDHFAMEGPVFRKMSAVELLPILPKLRVLARSSPEDKLTLVSMLKQQGEVVAVTGDGTNDAPALKESDVGLAMGIAGTEVAKEAADIVILDDNFSSIVKSVMWGRTVFSNIRKFLMFQLTVNFVALVISFFGAVIGGHEPLNVLQLLWVNLIMDTLGALALATEDPNPEILLERPYGRTESLINRIMWKHILIQGLYQLFWMFFILYAVPNIWDRYHIDSKEEYFLKDCQDVIGSPQVCGILNHCGIYYGDRYSTLCPLSDYWNNKTPPEGIPVKDAKRAMCEAFPSACPYDAVKAAKEKLDDEFTDHENKDYMHPLSLLFNVFIFCQFFNEINARRINDEYTIFVGLFTNRIFMGVLAITAVFQVIIINVPGLNNKFFKVQPLEWDEWLMSIAVGFGVIPLSLLVRFVSNNYGDFMCLRGTRVHASEGRTLSGRTGSGRTLSGKGAPHGARTMSGAKAAGSGNARTMSGGGAATAHHAAVIHHPTPAHPAPATANGHHTEVPVATPAALPGHIAEPIPAPAPVRAPSPAPQDAGALGMVRLGSAVGGSRPTSGRPASGRPGSSAGPAPPAPAPAPADDDVDVMAFKPEPSTNELSGLGPGGSRPGSAGMEEPLLSAAAEDSNV